LARDVTDVLQARVAEPFVGDVVGAHHPAVGGAARAEVQLAVGAEHRRAQLVVATAGKVGDDLLDRATGPEAPDVVVVGVVEVGVVPCTTGEGAALVPALRGDLEDDLPLP